MKNKKIISTLMFCSFMLTMIPAAFTARKVQAEAQKNIPVLEKVNVDKGLINTFMYGNDAIIQNKNGIFKANGNLLEKVTGSFNDNKYQYIGIIDDICYFFYGNIKDKVYEIDYVNLKTKEEGKKSAANFLSGYYFEDYNINYGRIMDSKGNFYITGRGYKGEKELFLIKINILSAKPEVDCIHIKEKNYIYNLFY